MTDTQAPAVVTEADRSAAWPHRPACYYVTDKWKWDAGIYDKCDIIQAFARHRLSTQSAMQARIEELEAALDMAAFRMQLLVDRLPPDEDGKTIKALSQSYVDEARATLSNIGGSNDVQT